MSILIITHTLQIALSEFEFSFVRSSGPGGQNVNKVNSKAVLRWNLIQSESVSVMMRDRLHKNLENKLTRDGSLIVASDVFRDQGRNREACIEKLKLILIEASFIPKFRKKTRPSFSSQKKVKDSKVKHSNKKKLRSSKDHHD